MHRHKLRVKAITPELGIVGKQFTITYTIQNIGDTLFPGGCISIQLGWPSLTIGVVHTIDISKPLSPGDEFRSTEYKELPLASGYTTFTVATVVSTDALPVEVYSADNRRAWPPYVPNAVQLFHATRIKCREEVIERIGIWIGATSLLILVVFQILDWIFRFIWGI